MTTERDRYLEDMGREPPAPRDDDPLGWQWEFRGTREEREMLAADVLGEPDPPEDPPEEFPTQEETLW